MILDTIERFLVWTVRKLGSLTVIRLGLLALALANVGWGLNRVIGKVSSGPLVTVALVAMLTGWFFGRTRMKGWFSALILILIGVIYLALTSGRLWNPLLIFLRTITPLTGQIMHCTIWPSVKQLLPCGAPNFGPMVNDWKTFALTAVTLVTRIGSWFSGVRSGIMVVDPLVAPILWGSAVWWVSAWAAWWVRRRDAALTGLGPALAGLAYTVYYTNQVPGIYSLVWAAGAMVLLQAAIGYLTSERRWNAKRMDRVLIEPAMAAAVILLAGGLMLGGGLLPSLSIQRINRAIQDILHPSQNKTLAESLGLQQGSSGSKPGRSGVGPVVISDIHSVGAGPHLSGDVVMYISVDGYNPLPPDIARLTGELQPEEIYYWRAQTYDGYNGHVWIANTNQTIPMLANAAYYPNLLSLPDNYKQVTQNVKRTSVGDKVLFFSGDLLRTDQATTAQLRAGGDLIDAQTDAKDYTAVSRVQNVSLEQLRAAGNDYSAYIRQHYLGLPDELPQRVRDLALNLTAGQLNMYDRAKAIETYLRKFTYTLEVPAPPSDRDVADYFLFDLKKGYCDYFATTMVVMSRAAGLPARLVTGYSSGSYDYNNHRFIVKAVNSHAWAEIYFPDIGWVEFEATPNLATFSHPGETQSPANAAANVPAPVPPKKGIGIEVQWVYLWPTIKILGGLLAVLVLLIFILPIETWTLYLSPADRAIVSIYNRLYRRSRIWGVDASAARTPTEFADALAGRWEPFAKNKKLGPRIKVMIQDLYRLTRLYNVQLFSPFELTKEEHHQAVQAWGRIRRGLGRLSRW